MTSPELLPCPFCGAQAEITHRLHFNWARCSYSDCFMNNHEVSPERWNRRSHLQPPGEWQIVSAARERDRILRARPQMTRDDYFDALGLAEQRLDAAIAAAPSSGDAMSKTVCACGRTPKTAIIRYCQYSSSDAVRLPSLPLLKVRRTVG
jgi:hypothetical protein